MVIFGVTSEGGTGKTVKEGADGLAMVELDLAQALRAALPHLKVSWLGESETTVQSRSPLGKEDFERCFKSSPVHACAERTSGMKRPRLYWASWQISSYADSKLHFNKSVEHTELGFMEDRRAAQDLEGGGLLRVDGRPLAGLASAARCRPRKKAPSCPIGLSLCNVSDLEIFAAGDYAYPPDHYCLNNMVRRSSGQARPLNSAEREWLLGFTRAHTEKCWSRFRRDPK
jgi:hypothetical protein